MIKDRAERKARFSSLHKSYLNNKDQPITELTVLLRNNAIVLKFWKIVKLDDFMNEITIPLKSNNLYYGIKRKLLVIHSQFRMQCSNLKRDLHSLHVVDDPVCICSNQIENCEHFFFHCYLYATQRVAFLA